MKQFLVTIQVWLFTFSLAFPQQSSSTLTVDFDQVTIIEALNQLSEHYGIHLVFSEDFFDSNQIISQKFINKSILEILKALVDPFRVEILERDDTYILRKKKEVSWKLYGRLISEESGDGLPFAVLYIQTIHKVVEANEDGFYFIELPEGSYSIQVNSLGHQVLKYEIQLQNNIRKDFHLIASAILPEVIVDEQSESIPEYKGNKFHNGRLMDLSLRTPGIGGGSDLLQTARYLPGIQSGAGGVGGFFVRGGLNDQNLFLLDGVAIYNPFHSIGLSSIFIPQTTKSLQVIKSAFHPKYGDRASSVIDVRLKEGNMNKYAGAVGVNAQDGFVKLEGPIINDRLSALMYFRSSLLNYSFDNIINDAFFPDVGKTEQVDYSDLVGKLKYRINSENDLFFTIYRGRDLIKAELTNEEEEIEEESAESDETRLSWGNTIYNLRWQHLVQSKGVLNLGLSLNAYSNGASSFSEFQSVDGEENQLEFASFASSNRDIEAKLSYDQIFSEAVKLGIGGGFLHKRLDPNVSILDEESDELSDVENPSLATLENLRLSNPIQVNKLYQFLNLELSLSNVNIDFGLRSTLFSNNGVSFFDFQPRASVDFQFHENKALSFAVSRARQYVHLLSLSNLAFPSDIWYPSGSDLSPLDTWHYNIGYKHQVSRGLQLNIQGYYKDYAQLPFTTIEHVDGASIVEGLNVVQGEARSYGVEVGMDLETPIFQGLLSYAWNNAEQKFSSVNLGRPFDLPFNRAHEIKMVLSKKLSIPLNLGLGLYAATGNSVLAISDLSLDQGLIPIEINPSGQKNQIKTPWQHRFDFSLDYTIQTDRFSHLIKLNIYNVYNADQPLFYFSRDARVENLLPTFSVPFIPSVAYTLQF